MRISGKNKGKTHEGRYMHKGRHRPHSVSSPWCSGVLALYTYHFYPDSIPTNLTGSYLIFRVLAKHQFIAIKLGSMKLRKKALKKLTIGRNQFSFSHYKHKKNKLFLWL